MNKTEIDLINTIKTLSLVHGDGLNKLLVLKSVEKMKDEELAYQLLIDKMPEYLGRFYQTNDDVIEDFKNWFNDERSKKINKTIKTYSSLISKNAFCYSNYPRYFFYKKNPLEVKALSFHKLVKLGLILNFDFMMHYLVHHMSVEEINEYYSLTMKDWGLYLAKLYSIFNFRVNCDKLLLLKNLLKYDSIELLEGVSKGNSVGVMELIPVIFEIDKNTCLTLLKILLTKVQKLGNGALRELIISTLKNYPNNLELTKNLICAPKINSRIVGVSFLIHNNEILQLKKVLKSETETKVINLINDYFKSQNI